jgi:hypothetical protein
LLFFIETELALRRWVAWLLGFAVRSIDRNSLSFAADLFSADP